jgi:hypothetical protein
MIRSIAGLDRYVEAALESLGVGMRATMAGNVSIKERKRPIDLNNPVPGNKVAEMILTALDPSTKIHPMAIPTTEEQGPPDCLIIDGSFKGQRHRVLVDGIHGKAKATQERMNRLAGYKKSLSAESGFFCVGEDISGEALIQCLKLGLTPVECSADGTRLRVHLGTVTVVRHVSIQSWFLSFFGSPTNIDGLIFEDKSEELLFQGKPVRNWLCRESRKLMQKAKDDCTLSVHYRLEGPAVFESQGRKFDADRFEARFVCRIQNRAHSLQADLADLEYQPHLRKVLWSGNIPRAFPRQVRIRPTCWVKTRIASRNCMFTIPWKLPPDQDYRTSAGKSDPRP